MGWQVGIDEAGYGPNLGPLVMTMVACRVPAPKTNLWRTLKKVVRRHGDKADGRPLVADSKLVHIAGKGLSNLEVGVLAFFHGSGRLTCSGTTLRELMTAVCAGSLEDFSHEPWFSGTTRLPVEDDHDWEAHADGWQRRTQATKLDWSVASVVILPQRFNEMVDRWGSKGAVLGECLTDLLRTALNLPGSEDLTLVIDKHGGRNQYSALLQTAFEDGMVLAREEGAERSYYEVIGLDRPVQVTFIPRADVTNFCVALGSMVCKYLREVIMGEFNQFWRTHVPGLEPTAGYHVDALRFFAVIEPALPKVGLTREQVWRKR
jgi:hypothetical protein